MADNILGGSVPTFLRSLSNLVQLDLSTNSLSGGVPSFVAAFRNLTYASRVRCFVRSLCALCAHCRPARITGLWMGK